MITPQMIDEWIREIEERPGSAPEIVRMIANRLSELDRINEQLRDENIQLRSGKKVESYQQKIDTLEYHLELLKRQLTAEAPVKESKLNLLVFNSKGQVLRVELDLSDIRSGEILGRFSDPLDFESGAPQLLLVSEEEELLFLYDTGRIRTLPVREISRIEMEQLDWQHSFLEEPGVGEELAAVLPVARMALYDFCIQSSRRGFIKRVVETFFENHMARGFIGSGVKLESDRTCCLVFANPEDFFIMVSREGALFCMETSQIPMTVEEALKLSATDSIITSINLGRNSSIAFITQDGKVIHRDRGWLEPATSLKTPGMAIISRERRERGIRLAGAVSGEEGDWGLALLEDGNIFAYLLGDLLAAGSIASGSTSNQVLSFALFSGRMDETSHKDG